MRKELSKHGLPKNLAKAIALLMLMLVIDNGCVDGIERYEDASLEYTGINKHEGENVSLFSTILSREDYEQMFVNKDIVEYNKG